MNVRTADEAQALMGELLSWARECPPREGLAVLQAWRNRVEICRVQIVAAQRAQGATDKQVDRLMGLGTTSRADRKRAKDRAETIGRNGELAQQVDGGALTIEQLDAVASADARTGGAAANDPALLADISAATADTARHAADKWLADRTTNAELEQRRRQQRRRREARRGTTADGLASLTIAGDDEAVGQMWAALAETADQLYRADGGRDLATGTHPRTNAQRLFDAAHLYLTGAPLLGSPSASPSGRSGGGAETTIVVTADKLNLLADRATDASTFDVSSADLSRDDLARDDLARDDLASGDLGCGDRGGCTCASPASVPAEMIGVGPIPDSLLEQLGCNADFVGLLFNGPGEVLWEGRRRRRPTKAQMVALVARDKGCVLCGEAPSRCEAHHLMPWSAPGRGETNIVEMALVCQRHHRELHEQSLTLYRDRTDGRWRTRPATPHETPKPRPAAERTRPERSSPRIPAASTDTRSATQEPLG